jgi:PAS domain S-box-containing protein
VVAAKHESEAWFRDIVNGTCDAYAAVDMHGSLIVFNPAAEALFGSPAQALLGRDIEESGLPEKLRQAMADAVGEAKAGCGVPPKIFEFEGFRGAEQFPVAAAYVFAAGTGENTVVAAHLHDITKRRQAERKSQRLGQILRTMSAGNQAMVRASDEDELYREMCRVTVELGGYRMAWIGLVEHDEDRSMRPVAFAGHEAGYLSTVKISWGDNIYGRGPCGMAVRTGTPQFNNEVKSNPAMAPWREHAVARGYLSSLALPLKDKGAVFGTLTIYASEPNAFSPEELSLLAELAENVSFGILTLRTRHAHDRMERALLHAQKLEAIGQMAGGIAHDVNNVLQIVESAARLMERRPDDAQFREMSIKSILDAGARASSLTRQLLAFSHRGTLEAKTVVPSLEAPKWRDLIKRSVREDICVDAEIPTGIWPVLCDPNSLEVALINLAVNARDAMPSGGTLTVSARNLSAGGKDFVEIEVADTGCGIDPEVLPRVFEPFFTTKPVGQGTGLGLSQVYGFTIQSGGSAGIESVLGHGTRIALRLPRSLREKPETAAGASDEEPLCLSLLIVDDNLEVALAVKNMAVAIGCLVTVADSPAKALNDLDAGEFDVLVTDLAMPGLSGLELAKAARAKDHNLGIILMSGYPQSFDMQDLGYELLPKPFSPASLRAALRRASSGNKRSAAGQEPLSVHPGVGV